MRGDPLGCLFNGRFNGSPNPGIPRAFDASNLTQQLWNSIQDSARDYAGSWTKWCPPTIVTGKVYLAASDNMLNMYGTLVRSLCSGGSISGVGNSSATAANLTTESSTKSGEASLNHKAGLAAQISDYLATGSVRKYNNDTRPPSWSDGGTVTAGNDTNGVYILWARSRLFLHRTGGHNHADAGGACGRWNSGGTLRAHLSDGSAANGNRMIATTR